MKFQRVRATRKSAAALAAGTLLFVAAALPAPARAVEIFSDDFNRPDSTVVGNGWVETIGDGSGNPTVERITAETLELRGNLNPQVTHSLSTLGLMDIVLSYEWRGVDNEDIEELRVGWSLDGSTFMELENIPLANSPPTFTSSSVDFPETAEDLLEIFIRFWLFATNGNDIVFVDNVNVVGDAIDGGGPPAGQVPEPGTIGLLGLALVAFGLLRRRNRR